MINSLAARDTGDDGQLQTPLLRWCRCLTADDLEQLTAQLVDEDYRQDASVRAVVERTYPRVIRLMDDDTVDVTGYDTSRSKNCDNEAIVLEIARAVHFDAQGNSVDRANDTAQHQILTEMADRMAAELTSQLGYPVAVFTEESIEQAS
jgi:hypothetical protein